MNIISEAMKYAELGYRVLPLKPGQKVPAVRLDHASTDSEDVINMFAHAGDGCGVGIELTDMAVLNIAQEADQAAVARLLSQISSEAGSPPPLAFTPRGVHLFFGAGNLQPDPITRRIPNCAGEILTGARQYVVAPPTIISGARYAFGPGGLPPITELPELPRFLLELAEPIDSPDTRWGLPAHKAAEQILRTRGRVETIKLAANLRWLLSETGRHTEGGGEADFPF